MIDALDIFRMIATPIINSADRKNIIPKSILNVPPILLISFTIFLSANGSLIAAVKLYKILNVVNLIIGVAQIPIIIITPTIPTAFFINEVAPKTVSTESPKALPTTGTNVDVAVFIPFIVIPSILLVSVPSKESTPHKNRYHKSQTPDGACLQKFSQFAYLYFIG